jgi:hypothetical protein
MASPTRDLRQRLVLDVVDREPAAGFEVPPRGDGSPAFRGPGALDYACGRCARLLAIGVRRGVFAGFLWRCACGATNRAPQADAGALRA